MYSSILTLNLALDGGGL